jgi:hypothetical protein
MHKARLKGKPGFAIGSGSNWEGEAPAEPLCHCASIDYLGSAGALALPSQGTYFFPKSPGLPNKPPPFSPLVFPPRSGSFRLRSYC